MEEMTERQRFLLSLIVHEYVRSASPVGSQTLVDTYKLDMSSATVRNELSELTEMGLLRQPHTSAGRVPTEDGYRYFVSRLIQDIGLPEDTRSMISHQFYQMRNDVDQWMRLAASVLAQQSKAASLVTSPHPAHARVKHLELIATCGSQVLMVMVMFGGQIHQRILALNEPVLQEMLSQTANALTNQIQNLDQEGIRKLQANLTGLELEISNKVLEEMGKVDTLITGEVYLDGLSNVLSEPEFAGNEEARRALQVLEERTMLDDLLSRTVLHGGMSGVQVFIGGEGTLDELRQCSIILARYGSPDLATGTLGILGPMRMSYGRSISIVRYISSLLSDLVSESLVDENTAK
jgi:heat-inducible transcriptional repressor